MKCTLRADDPPAQSTTLHHEKHQNDNNKHYENCHNLRDTNAQLSLTCHPPAPPHLNEKNTLSKPTTRNHSYSVKSLHPALSCEPQQVLLNPSSFYIVPSASLHLVLSLTLAPSPGASPLHSKRHTRSRRVLTP